jgi:hypothetical protein
VTFSFLARDYREAAVETLVALPNAAYYELSNP